MNPRSALEEAARCHLCVDAPCRTGCPARVDPRLFIRKIRLGDLAGAARHLRRHNILAGTCAEICPSRRQCGGACLSEKLSRPIDIAGLQRFVCQWERERREMEVEPVRPWRERVAVVGAGPAGLACAAGLALRGFAVAVFDREPHAGGLLWSVLPPWRLPAEVLDHDISLVEALGVTFCLGRSVAAPDALLAEGFAAVFVAAGAAQPVSLGIDGEDHPRVHDALDLLRRAKTDRPLELGRRVAVIGGGDTAIDAARTARRGGCDVAVLYRRTRGDMPAYDPEVTAAWDEGIEWLFRVVPLAIEGAPAGRGSDPTGAPPIAGVRLQRVRWAEAGRAARSWESEGQPFLFVCDDVIVAAGLRPMTVATDRPGVFVGGDAATGPSTAVEAVARGRAAAEQIDEYLTSHGARVGALPAPVAPPEPPQPSGARDLYRLPRAELAVTFCGVRFENPFVLAAAPGTDDLEMLRGALRAGWAGAVLKTTSVEGTPVPLVYPMISAVEFEGRGIAALGNIDLISTHHVDEVESRIGTLKAEFPTRAIIASIMGGTREDWESLTRRVAAAGADLIECSFSCPQGTLGSRPGFMLGQDPERVRTVAGWVKQAAGRTPVVIKITPQVADIVEIARAAADAGCDAICASNTIPSLTGINLETWTPEPDVVGASTYSGLSGPAIRPLTLRTIAEIARHTGLPITGTGGPTTWRDAVQFMLVGATTVQFCTAVMCYGRDIIEDLCEGLAHYLDRRGLRSPRELVGGALPRIVAHEALPRGRAVRARIDRETCIGDGACFISCRDGGHRAIAFGADRVPVVDDERCVGCGLCGLVCPVEGCITLEPAV